MKLTSPSIKPVRYPSLVTQFKSKPAPKRRRRNFICVGGPFDGQTVDLEISGHHVQTAEFGVQSYNDGERGRYFRHSTNMVEWIKV